MFSPNKASLPPPRTVESWELSWQRFMGGGHQGMTLETGSHLGGRLTSCGPWRCRPTSDAARRCTGPLGTHVERGVVFSASCFPCHLTSQQDHRSFFKDVLPRLGWGCQSGHRSSEPKLFI